MEKSTPNGESRLVRSLQATVFVVSGLLLVPAMRAGTPELIVPRYQSQQLLLASAELGEGTYLMPPTLVRTGEREILITTKRGKSHGWETEADCEMIRFDPVANRVIGHETVGHVPGRKFQLTLGTFFGDGHLALYTDFQTTGDDSRAYRDGMRFSVSSDRGATFGPWRELGLIDGVEYGYPLDFIVEGHTAYMLAMSFGYRPGGRWSVAALKSDDDGATWKFLRNLSEEFGKFPINESGFVRQGDGFLVATRGYDHTIRLQRTDAAFKLAHQVNLTASCPYVKDYIGWPRLFQREGKFYLLGRNWTQPPASKIPNRPPEYPGIPDNQQLCLLRFDPESLEVNRVAILDNADARYAAVDGYYAAPYWQSRDGREMFNTIIYRAIGLRHPDIVRLEFDWAEVK